MPGRLEDTDELDAATVAASDVTRDDPAENLAAHPRHDRWHWRRKIRSKPRQLRVYRVVVAIAGLLLIVLGGLASLPQDPYEAAKIDGASPLQSFWHITLPLLAPFIVVALIIRTIDALKAFDTIYVITQGGPGTSSETINIFLYLQGFAYYNMGYASAVVVVFFSMIVGLASLLLWTRKRVKA